MPRRKPRKLDDDGQLVGQEALIPRPPTRRGRVERAVDEAARAARKAGVLESTHVALLAQARSSARMVDQAEHRGDGWAHAANARELRETLRLLGWAPREGEGRDSLDEFLDGLAQAEIPHPA